MSLNSSKIAAFKNTPAYLSTLYSTGNIYVHKVVSNVNLLDMQHS